MLNRPSRLYRGEVCSKEDHLSGKSKLLDLNKLTIMNVYHIACVIEGKQVQTINIISSSRLNWNYFYNIKTTFNKSTISLAYELFIGKLFNVCK